MILLVLGGCLAITDAQYDARLHRHDTGSDADADTDADSDTDADTDADSDSDTDTDADPCADGTLPALLFAAPADTVDIPSSAGLDFGDAWTVEAWIYYKGTPGAIWGKWTDGKEDKRLVVAEGNYVEASVTTDLGEATVIGQTVASGAWVHVALQAYDGTVTLYQDGVATGAAALLGTVENSAGDAHIGGIYRTSQQGPMGGGIAEVRISKVARYVGGFTPAPYLDTDADTVALWPLDEGTGSLALDVSGHGHDGGISGPTWNRLTCR